MKKVTEKSTESKANMENTGVNSKIYFEYSMNKGKKHGRSEHESEHSEQLSEESSSSFDEHIFREMRQHKRNRRLQNEDDSKST
jgi:hypothetical protein